MRLAALCGHMRACERRSDAAAFAAQTRQCSGWVSVGYQRSPGTEARLSRHLIAGALGRPTETEAPVLSFPKAASHTNAFFFFFAVSQTPKEENNQLCHAALLAV